LAGEKKVVIRGVCKKFGEWYQKTNKTEDTNKLTLLAFKIIAILHNTLLATFIKLLETVSKGLFRNRSQNRCHTFLDCRRVVSPFLQTTKALRESSGIALLFFQTSALEGVRGQRHAPAALPPGKTRYPL
jgi:hypothetical protein